MKIQPKQIPVQGQNHIFCPNHIDMVFASTLCLAQSMFISQVYTIQLSGNQANIAPPQMYYLIF
jgi:hypothetical protein